MRAMSSAIAERLRDVVVAAQLEAVDLAVLLEVGRQEDDGDVDVGRLEVLVELKARLVGKDEVQKDEVCEIALQELEGVGGAVADLRPHAGVLKVLGDKVGQLLLVLDHHDEGLGAWPRRRWIWHKRANTAFYRLQARCQSEPEPRAFCLNGRGRQATLGSLCRTKSQC